MAEYNAAFQHLADLAQKSLDAAQQLPAQEDATPQWSGVGFSMFGKRFVVSMGELNEMLEVPIFTKLPGVKPWVKGVANVRGRLLPIFDLAAFLGRHSRAIENNSASWSLTAIRPMQAFGSIKCSVCNILIWPQGVSSCQKNCLFL